MQNYIEYYLASMRQLCPEIKEEHLFDFRQSLYCRTVPKRTEVYSLNSFHNSIGFIVKGLVRTYYIEENGEEKTAWFTQEDGYITDYPSFLNGKPSNYIFETMEDSIIVFLPKKAIYTAYQQQCSIQKYGRLIAEQVIQQLQHKSEYLHNRRFNRSYHSS
ncbi:MAG: cyclic nucleotide-binding domain-containing protein [Bacteroidota bacterium]